MFKRTIPIAVAALLSLSAGAAGADQIFHPSNDEPGTVMHSVPGTKSRAQVDVEQNVSMVTADGWRYVGGDAGWELVQHDYEFRNGTLAHTDKCDHRITPKPSLSAIEEGRKLYQNLYSGG